MKHMLLLVFLFPIYLLAQDVEMINLKNGAKFEASVQKINPDSIFLRRDYNNQYYEMWVHDDDIVDWLELYQKYYYLNNPLVLNESGKIFFERVIQVPGVSADSIYIRLIDWYGHAFKNPESVIRFNNRETGKINGIFYDDYKGYKTMGKIYYVKVKSSIEIAIKDNRFKVVITDFENDTYSAEMSIFKDDGSIIKMYKPLYMDLAAKIPVLLDNIDFYVNNYKKIDTDW